MVYYLNELSILNPCASEEAQAKELMMKFTTICRKVKKIGFDNLRYDIRLKGICLATDYYVESWLKDISVERELRDRFKSITVNTPFIDTEEEKRAIDKYIYSYGVCSPIGLGLALFRETIAISFLTDNEWDTHCVNVDYVDDDNVHSSDVLHVADVPHLESLKRIFEFNPKHGICGHGAFPNQSVMYCCTKEEAEILLNTALPHPKKARWFCNFDERNNRFVVFLPHEVEQGKYHGFHYENTPNLDPDRDLNNPQNGIPQVMQDKLKKRMSRNY